MTPTMVCGLPLMVIFSPMTLGFAPKRRCQRPWLMTTTRFLPVVSSSGRKPRPSAGATPTTWKKLAEVDMAGTRSGSRSPSVIVPPA